MTVYEEFRLFKKTVLELGFEEVKPSIFRWYINPILYVDIEFRAEYLLYTLKMSICKPKEPLGSLEYKKNIYKVDDWSWCDKYYIKGIVQAMFADMIIKHIELSWGTVIMK